MNSAYEFELLQKLLESSFGNNFRSGTALCHVTSIQGTQMVDFIGIVGCITLNYIEKTTSQRLFCECMSYLR